MFSSVETWHYISATIQYRRQALDATFEFHWQYLLTVKISIRSWRCYASQQPI